MAEPTSDKVTIPSDIQTENALTKKFTEAEWSGVKVLRDRLADIFASVYNENADAKTTSIKLWGVTVDPSNPVDARVSVILVKFLRARNLNAVEAETMLISTLKWRKEQKVDDYVNQEFPKEIFGNLGYVSGKDKEGRPVTYNIYGGNNDMASIFGDLPRFIKWRVALMEKGIAQLDFQTVDQMVQVHDYEGVSMTSRTPESKVAAAEATKIFQDYYPEFLYKKFFVNVPTIFTWIFWLFKPLVSAQTLAKMTVVGSGAPTIGKELLPLIDTAQLPQRYGGESAAF